MQTRTVEFQKQYESELSKRIRKGTLFLHKNPGSTKGVKVMEQLKEARVIVKENIRLLEAEDAFEFGEEFTAITIKEKL